MHSKIQRVIFTVKVNIPQKRVNRSSTNGNFKLYPVVSHNSQGDVSSLLPPEIVKLLGRMDK